MALRSVTAASWLVYRT